jgi:hypothetical protein
MEQEVSSISHKLASARTWQIKHQLQLH